MFHIRRIPIGRERTALSPLLEIDEKTTKDNSPPSVGMYSTIHTCTCIECSRIERPLPVCNEVCRFEPLCNRRDNRTYVARTSE